MGLKLKLNGPKYIVIPALLKNCRISNGELRRFDQDISSVVSSVIKLKKDSLKTKYILKTQTPLFLMSLESLAQIILIPIDFYIVQRGQKAAGISKIQFILNQFTHTYTHTYLTMKMTIYTCPQQG